MLQVPLEVIHTLGVLGLLAEWHVRLALASKDGLTNIDTGTSLHVLYTIDKHLFSNRSKQCTGDLHH